MAYFCLTVLEASAGGRPHERRTSAAELYHVDRTVLKTLGDLTSDVGDQMTARKTHFTYARAHSRAEIAWMEAVVQRLIRRAGEVAFDPGRAWPQITMADFPPP